MNTFNSWEENHPLSYRKHRTEVVEAMRHRAEQGLPTTKLPLGYILTSNGIEQDIMVTAFIKRAFALFAKTGSLEYVLGFLEDMRIVSQKGHPITAARLRYILSNSFYAGIITYQGKSYPGKHEPVVDMEIFNRVQEFLHESP